MATVAMETVYHDCVPCLCPLFWVRSVSVDCGAWPMAFADMVNMSCHHGNGCHGDRLQWLCFVSEVF